MSSYSNKRTDEYGGALPKRMRFVREIIEVVRSKVGADFPVLFRISLTN
jgi:2,4-dienoyl-CoA reductase-like NADH-dependent reductase (Old Yellow Enzyme family)